MKDNDMASAAETMAANLSWATLGKAKDLRQRIVFTVLLLIVYRLGTYIPVPGAPPRIVGIAPFLVEPARMPRRLSMPM